MKHTELPWKIHYDGEDYMIYNDKDEPVGDIMSIFEYTGQTIDIQRENAEFIVKACNEHYERIEREKKLIEALDKIGAVLSRNLTEKNKIAKINDILSDIEGENNGA